MLRTLKNSIRNKVWVFLKAKWKLRSGIQLCVKNDSDWFVFNEIFTNKEYDAVFSVLLSSASSKPLILDLGANVGYFTLRVADELILAGINDFEIISLEASPGNFKVLQTRVDQPLLKKRVRCFLGLAGHKTGSGKVVHSDQHYGHSSAIEGEKSRIASVGYVDIEKLIADSAKRINLLKCDIEGSEEIFLTAYPALLSRIDHAVFEFHAGECNVENCRNLLHSAGLNSKGIIKEESNYKTVVEIFSRG
jgi:FkbM family methyltransferase